MVIRIVLLNFWLLTGKFKRCFNSTKIKSVLLRLKFVKNLIRLEKVWNVHFECRNKKKLHWDKNKENVLNKFISTKIIYLDNRILEKEQHGKSEYEPKYWILWIAFVYRMLSLQPDRSIDRFWIKILSEVNVIHKSKNINQILNCSQPLNQNIKLIVWYWKITLKKERKHLG